MGIGRIKGSVSRKERNNEQQKSVAASDGFDATRVVIGRVRWSTNQTDCHVSATYRYVDAANSNADRNADRHTRAANGDACAANGNADWHTDADQHADARM